SKVMAEQGISALASDRFCPVFLRSATAYGVSPRLRLDVVLNNLTAWAHTTGTVVLKSDGSPWRPVVHVTDIARAFLAVLRTPASLASNQAFNVGNSTENFRIRELAGLVASAVPDCAVKLAQGAGPDTRSYRVSCTKALRTLQGFRPRWTARAGV